MGKSQLAGDRMGGTWPVDEYWWDSEAARDIARLQVLLDGGRALLIVHGTDGWRVEGIYD